MVVPEDRCRYILERPPIRTPGASWTYCGGAPALLARIIAKRTGKALHAFAREALFDPLGSGRPSGSPEPTGSRSPPPARA